MLEVTPPDGLTPEGWLIDYDRIPKILPDWPESKQMCIVCVRDVPTEDDPEYTEAFVLFTPEDVDEAYRMKGRTLFFIVPRSLLFSTGVCPGLTAECWPT